MATPIWKAKPPLDAPANGVWLGAGPSSGTDGVWLGTVAELRSGKVPKIWLSTAKEQVVAIVGKRGSGKSFTLGVLAEGFCLQSNAVEVARQERPRAGLLFDPLDVYWTARFSVTESKNAEVQRHFKMAQAAKLTGLEFAVDAWVPGVTYRRETDPDWFQTLQLPVSRLGVNEWELLLGINTMTDPMGHALMDALELAASLGFHRSGRAVPPKSAYLLADVAEAVASDELDGVYHRETLRALRQKVSALHGTGLFSDTGTPIEHLLLRGRMAVILLGRLPQSSRIAVVATVTRMLIDARSELSFIEKRLQLDPTLSDEDRVNLSKKAAGGVPRTVVALDEAQNFLAPERGSVARDVFVRLVKEGRNIGLSAILATQQPSALDPRVLSQVETFIAHQLVTEPDLRAVADNLKAMLPEAIEFGSQKLDAKMLLRTLPSGNCLISAADMNTQIRRSFIGRVRPRATVHGGTEL